MKDRIEVDGVWYIKEPTITETEPIELDPTYVESCVVESNKYCYEASRLKNDDGTFYDDVSIKITIKDGKREDWKEDYWDHQSWMLGVLENNPESLPEFEKSIHNKKEQDFCKAMLQNLVDIGWLKDTKQIQM